MRIILFTLLCISICQAKAGDLAPYAIPDDQEEKAQFCMAWTQDAMQATEKRLQGVDPVKLMGLIDSIPDELLPPDAKERAQSAIGWAYTYPMDMIETGEMAEIRCNACIDEINPIPCLKKFDEALSKVDRSEINF